MIHFEWRRWRQNKVWHSSVIVRHWLQWLQPKRKWTRIPCTRSYPQPGFNVPWRCEHIGNSVDIYLIISSAVVREALSHGLFWTTANQTCQPYLPIGFRVSVKMQRFRVGRGTFLLNASWLIPEGVLSIFDVFLSLSSWFCHFEKSWCTMVEE